MQNKANFRKSQMNVNTFTQMAYENKSNWTLGENKPNSNPNKANFQKAQMNVNSFITKDYRKEDDFAVQKNKANSKPIQTQTKPIFKSEDRSQKAEGRRQKAEGRRQKAEGRRQKAEGRRQKAGRLCSGLKAGSVEMTVLSRNLLNAVLVVCKMINVWWLQAVALGHPQAHPAFAGFACSRRGAQPGRLPPIKIDIKE